MKDHVSKQLNDLSVQLPPSALFIPDKLEAYFKVSILFTGGQKTN